MTDPAADLQVVSSMADPAPGLSLAGPMQVPSSVRRDRLDELSPPTADAAMAARIRAGDAGAFKTMFDVYYVELHAYVVALTQDKDLADECVQDVMYNIWALGPRWKLRGSIQAYLVVAVRNYLSGRRRHDRVASRWEAAASGGVERTGMGQGPEPTDEACRRNEVTAALHAALGHLPERRRLAVTLRWEYHLANAEVARTMGTSVKYVEREIMLGLRAIRRELEKFF